MGRWKWFESASPRSNYNQSRFVCALRWNQRPDRRFQRRLSPKGVFLRSGLHRSLAPVGAVDPTYDQHFDTYYSLPAKVRLKWLSRFQPSGSLLEVGCGSGQFLALARAHGYQVAAVEPNPRSARSAARLLGIEVEQALIEESGLPPQSYDVVFHIDLLSHFPDPVKALRKMAELTRPGGVVCFEVGIGALPRRWSPLLGRPGYPQHLWHFTEEAVRGGTVGQLISAGVLYLDDQLGAASGSSGLLVMFVSPLPSIFTV